MAQLLSSKVGGFTKFIKSDSIILVASAIFITPLTLGFVSSLATRVPFIGNNIFLTFFIAAILIFLIAGMVGTRLKLQPLLLGISAGLAFNAILSTSFGQKLTATLRRSSDG